MTTYALFVGFVLLVCALGFLMCLDESRRNRRVTRELIAAQERAERQARVNKFAADTRAAFEAQMPDRVAQVERIRAQIAENETRRFIEAWDRGEVQS